MIEPIALLLSASREEDAREIEAFLPSDAYRIQRESVAAGGASETQSAEADVRLVVLPPDFAVVGEPESFTFAASPHPVLYVLSDPSARARQWAFRRGAFDVLVRPFTGPELRLRIERAIGADRWRFEQATTERRTLEFLQGLLRRNIRVLYPSMDPGVPGGYFYPEVTRVFGRSAYDGEFLARLADEGTLSPALFDRVRLCPQCLHSTLNFREVCPRCESVDVIATEAIHHFACGHVGGIETFRRGADLVCPKCNTPIRHIGLDYEKPSEHFICGDCDFVISDPKVTAQCLRCGCSTDPSRSVARNIFNYELTPLAQQAVDEQHLGGMNLSKLLRNRQTGLYTRQFFELQAEREFLRAKRHNKPFCVLMIRIEGFDQIVNEHPEKATDYVNSIFVELSSKLRALDMTCVWGRDVLGVLLPDTPLEGGSVVAGRMEAGVRGLEYLYSIREPRLSIGVVAWKNTYESYWEVLGEALRSLPT